MPDLPLIVDQIIARAYRIAGIQTEAGRGPSPSQSDEGLYVLNSMIDAFRTQGLLFYAEAPQPMTLVTGRNNYSIGTSGTTDLVVQRPEKIRRANWVIQGSSPEFEEPMYCMTREEWDDISIKTLQVNITNGFHYEATAPNGTLYVYPNPGYPSKIILYLEQAMTQIAGLGTNLFLATGYQRALEYNLAVDLATAFPDRAKLSPLSVQIAASTLANIKVLNWTYEQMHVEAAMRGNQNRGYFNIWTNDYGN